MAKDFSDMKEDIKGFGGSGIEMGNSNLGNSQKKSIVSGMGDRIGGGGIGGGISGGIGAGIGGGMGGGIGSGLA